MTSTSLIRAACVTIVGALCLSAPLQATGRAPVADAAEQRDVATVRALLQQGADASAAQGDGMTALHWAALNGDAGLVGVLLYAGANTGATTRLGGYTPLHLAVRDGHAAVAARLVEAGADVKARTSTGATPLMLAARAGRLDTAELLLDHGADPNARESAYGETALMFAAALDRVDIVRLLVARKADTSVASTFVDLKALALPEPPTAQSGRAAAAVGGGAEAEDTPAASRGPKKPPQIAGVNRPYRYNELIGAQGGLTALHFAARQGNLKSVEALVDGGANVNAVSPADRTTPLLIATINGQFDLAMYLLAHGADPNLASDAGTTPLYAAVNVQWAPKAAYPQPRAYLQQRNTYLDLMRTLLDKGAEPNARINRKIWYSSYNFDQSNVDEAGATAFWRAAYAADVDAMRLLVTHGADAAHPDDARAGTARSGQSRRQGRVGTAGGADGRAEHDGAAGGGGSRLQQGVRRQLAPRRAGRACWRR